LWLLADLPTLTAAIMMFAAGGIRYLTFQDIAPQARLERHWAPPLGAVAGFAMGLAGAMLLGR
jgi:ZIP family zinc transporter